MTQDSESVETRPAPPPLKVVEQEPDPENPWADDVLERKQVAERLTRIIEGQEVPFVISVDGQWGTGKTFLLKRWRQDLENHEWQAIYFNAWKDDFSDDPLLAIIGQLSDYFDDGALKQLALAVAGAALAVLTKHLTGTPVTLEDLKPEGLLAGYREQHKTKDLLKDELASLASAVKDETGQPVVFIIDELDRCRPTFAIELLERVKHIFDVPNVVFVFGINRSELVESLQSVYGEIDAGIYLRRFFDMELVLPEADIEKFCMWLFDVFGIKVFLDEMSRYAGNRVHSDEFHEMTLHAPPLFRALSLSLRDIDQIVRLIALLGKTLEPQYYIYPPLLASLLSLKIIDRELYKQFIHRECSAGAVMDCFEQKYPALSARVKAEENVLKRIELSLYCVEAGPAWEYLTDPSIRGEPDSVPENAFSRRTQADRGRLNELLKDAVGFFGTKRMNRTSLAHIAKMIDLYQAGA
ncbi:MAG: P-loop NTPase fold protein [Chloroflexi bacterium]|nr:P-loop NTPase fold protein [Chloroflexota bacterium]